MKSYKGIFFVIATLICAQQTRCSLPLKKISTLEELKNFELTYKKTVKNQVKSLDPDDLAPLINFLLETLKLFFLDTANRLEFKNARTESFLLSKELTESVQQLAILEKKLNSKQANLIHSAFEKELKETTGYSYRDCLRALRHRLFWCQKYKKYFLRSAILAKSLDDDNAKWRFFSQLYYGYKTLCTPCSTTECTIPKLTNKGCRIGKLSILQQLEKQSLDNDAQLMYNKTCKLEKIIKDHQKNGEVQKLEEHLITNPSPHSHLYLALYQVMLKQLRNLYAETSTNPPEEKNLLLRKIDKYLILLSIRYLMVQSHLTEEFHKLMNEFYRQINQCKQDPVREAFFAQNSMLYSQIENMNPGFYFLIYQFPFEDESNKRYPSCSKKTTALLAWVRALNQDCLKELIEKKSIKLSNELIGTAFFPKSNSTPPTQTFHSTIKKLKNITFKLPESKIIDDHIILKSLVEGAASGTVSYFFFRPLDKKKFPSSHSEKINLTKEGFPLKANKFKLHAVPYALKHVPEAFLAFKKEKLPPLFYPIFDFKNQKLPDGCTLFICPGGALMRNSVSPQIMEQPSFKMFMEFIGDVDKIEGSFIAIKPKDSSQPWHFSIRPALSSHFPLNKLFGKKKNKLELAYEAEQSISQAIAQLFSQQQLPPKDLEDLFEKVIDDLGLFFALLFFSNLKETKEAGSCPETQELLAQLFAQSKTPIVLSKKAATLYKTFKQTFLPANSILPAKVHATTPQENVVILRNHIGLLRKLERIIFSPEIPYQSALTVLNKEGNASLRLARYYKDVFSKLLKIPALSSLDPLIPLWNECAEQYNTEPLLFTYLDRLYKRLDELDAALTKNNNSLTAYSKLNDDMTTEKTISMLEFKEKLFTLRCEILSAERSEKSAITVLKSLDKISRYIKNLPSFFLEKGYLFLTAYRALFLAAPTTSFNQNMLMKSDTMRLLSMRDFIELNDKHTPTQINHLFVNSALVWKFLNPLLPKTIQKHTLFAEREKIIAPFITFLKNCTQGKKSKIEQEN